MRKHRTGTASPIASQPIRSTSVVTMALRVMPSNAAGEICGGMWAMLTRVHTVRTCRILTIENTHA